MRIRRTLPLFLAVVAVAAAIALAVQLRKHAPPEPARLLPGADAFFYLDLHRARHANSGKELPAVSHDPEYERFIRETGFQFERDLDEAAFAVHYPGSWPGAGSGGNARELRFSEVLVGKFHSELLTAYLRKVAQSVEDYHSDQIFTISLEGRSLRVAVLNADSVAASNHDDPAVIRAMIDRSKRLASPFGGPALLRQYYKHVQLASLAWAVARIDPGAPGAAGGGAIVREAGHDRNLGELFESAASDPRGNSHSRRGVYAVADDAREIADKLTTFVAITHSAEASAGTHGTDADVKALFDSVKVKQEGERAVLTAAMPFGFLRKMSSGARPEPNQPTAAPVQPPASAPMR